MGTEKSEESNFVVMRGQSSGGVGLAYALSTLGSYNDEMLFSECFLAVPNGRLKWRFQKFRFTLSRQGLQRPQAEAMLRSYARESLQAEMDAAVLQLREGQTGLGAFPAPYEFTPLEQGECGLWLRDVFGPRELDQVRRLTACAPLARYVSSILKLGELRSEPFAE